MKKSRVSQIKREQKKSNYLRKISSLIQSLALDEPSVAKVFITRVELSADGGICYVYFSTYDSPEAFDVALETLKLYKPSMRSSLAKQLKTRYVPDLVFMYDKARDKQRRIDLILSQISSEDTKKE
jgi:ribosome-binding factor A